MVDMYEQGWTIWADMKEFGPASRHVRRLVWKLIRETKFRSICDVGCGVGNLLQEISRHNRDVQLTGTEFAGTGLEIAAKLLPEAQFHLLDLSKEPLAQQFDLITCIDVIEHIEDDINALKNLRSMTAGSLIIVVPLGPLFEVERVRVGHVHGYSRKEFEAKLKDAGFRIERAIQWGFPFYNIYRRMVHALPEASVSGKFNWRKKLVSTLGYYLLFLNLPFWGERFFILCKPEYE